MKDAPSSWVSTALASELWRRLRREATHCSTEVQKNTLPVLLKKLSGHWFPGTCSHFPKVKGFSWRAGLEIFCRTIFSLPGGHPAPLRNICKRQTISRAPVFLLPRLTNHFVIQHDLYLELVFHSSLQDLPSIFTSDIPPITLLCFPVRRRKAALLRYQHLGSLLQPFIFPR